MSEKRIKPKIMWVDDNPQWTLRMEESLKHGFKILPVSSLAEFEKIVEIEKFDAAIVDVNFESAESDASRYAGLRIAEALRATLPDLPIIMTSSYLGGLDREISNRALHDIGIDVLINKDYAGTPDVMGSALLQAIRVAKKRRVKDRSRDKEEYKVVDVRRILIEEIDKYSTIKERTVSIPGAGNYELIKPLVGFKRDIEKRLSTFPFEHNVFLMMKFRNSNRELAAFIVETLRKYGLLGVRADHVDWNITKNVYNPIAVLYCCKFGIALFDEPEDGQAYSPNVAYELGMMHYQNKDCLLLRHSSLPAVPFDLVKDLYVTYDKDLQVRKIIESWIKQVTANQFFPSIASSATDVQ